MELSELNRLSVEHRFDLDELDWGRPVDPGKLWAPVATSPLSYLPSFSRLEPGQRLRYNQLFALGVCEQFIWFERDLLCPALRWAIDARAVPPELREALGHFVAEEEKHVEMFWRLLEKAEPALYPRGARRFGLFSLSPLHRVALKSITSMPSVFLAWIWVAVVFEERTLDFSHHYTLAERAHPDAIDFCFAQCHRFHLKDEVRHHRMDEHLIRWLYEGARPWQRRAAAATLHLLMRSYTSPKRTSLAVLGRLDGELGPAVRGATLALRGELEGLRECMEFQKLSFSEKSVGRSLELLARYPEFDSLWPLMKAVSKDQLSTSGRARL